jgi:hypothetical protein
VYILPEDGHRSGLKHVVVVHNKIEHEKHLLRTVVLIKVLDDNIQLPQPIDSINLLGSWRRRDVFPVKYGHTYRAEMSFK